MHPEDIGRAYDLLAPRWASETFPADNGIAAHEEVLRHAPSGGWALDVGCGCNPRLPRLLLERGYQVDAVDVSARMIGAASVALPEVMHHLADITHWPLPRGYAFITAWDSLWHLPLAAQIPVLRKLIQGLEPGGVFIFSMGGLDEPSEKEDHVMGPLMYYSTPGISAVLHLLAEENCQCIRMQFDQYPEPHLVVSVRRR